MELERDSEQEVMRQIEDILFSDEDPIAKVQEMVKMGFDEEVANDIVERYQIGQSSVIYYEQLPKYGDH